MLASQERNNTFKVLYALSQTTPIHLYGTYLLRVPKVISLRVVFIALSEMKSDIMSFLNCSKITFLCQRKKTMFM